MSKIMTMLQRVCGLLTGEKVDGRRSNFFVEKEFQKSFILFFLVMVSLLIAVSGLAYYLFLQKILEESMFAIHPKFASIREVLTPNIMLFFGVMSVIAFVIIVITVDKILRGIAKSLMAFERIAERLAKLDFRKARTIETRHFHNLHRQYMDLIDKYSMDISLLREKVMRINMLVRFLEESEDMPKEKKIVALTELIELKGAVESKLAEFQLEDFVKRS